jgi:plastocyanin
VADARAAGLLALALLACAPARAAGGATHTVTIENMQFSPAELTVKRGDRVTWVNKDLVAHTATAAHAFDTHDIEPGRSWSHVMDEPGRYPYVCTFHPAMKATLIVE